MSECQGHILSFMPAGTLGVSKAWTAVSDKPADVADLMCLVCGHTLFVYYRHAPREGEAIVEHPEGNAHIRADHSPQPQDRPQQQKEGDKE